MIRAALVVAALCAAVIWWQRIELRAARADLAQARAVARGLDAAARYMAADAGRQAEAVATDQELKRGSGADAPLSNYLRGGVGRVWR